MAVKSLLMKTQLCMGLLHIPGRRKVCRSKGVSCVTWCDLGIRDPRLAMPILTHVIRVPLSSSGVIILMVLPSARLRSLERAIKAEKPSYFLRWCDRTNKVAHIRLPAGPIERARKDI